jgi:hypothetical protein
MKFTPENARQKGRQGGKQSSKRRLSLKRVEAELGPLESIEDAMRRLDRLGLWITAGMLSGSAGSAAVRSVEVWLRGHEGKIAAETVTALGADVARLKAALAGTRAKPGIIR